MVRIKERYLLVNVLYPIDCKGNPTGTVDAGGMPHFVAVRRNEQLDVTPQQLLRGIKAEVRALFGDCGAGAVERTLSVKYLCKETSTFILRVTREQLRYVWAGLTCMHHVPTRDGPPCVFRVTRVSGTIRKVEEEAIRQSRILLVATRAYVAGRVGSAYDMLTSPAVLQELGRPKPLPDIFSQVDDDELIEDGTDSSDDGGDVGYGDGGGDEDDEEGDEEYDDGDEEGDEADEDDNGNDDDNDDNDEAHD